jgi:hypothetical protein
LFNSPEINVFLKNGFCAVSSQSYLASNSWLSNEVKKDYMRCYINRESKSLHQKKATSLWQQQNKGR